MGLLQTIGIAKSAPAAGKAAPARAGARPPGTAVVTTGKRAVTGPPNQGKKRKKRKGQKLSGPAASLQDRRRRLVGARDVTLRDLGGLMLEMYKRNRFREELLLDKCEEVLAIEVEVAHIDQRLFQLASPSAAGQKPIGRCECGTPLMPGQNFCASCGRALGTLTQSRPCARCGNALRAGDAFCASCGNEAPDALEALAAPAAAVRASSSVSTSTVRDNVPPLNDMPPRVPTEPITHPESVTQPIPMPAATYAADAPTTVIDIPDSSSVIEGAAVPTPSEPTRPALTVVESSSPQTSDVAIQAALSVLPPLPDAIAGTPTFPTQAPADPPPPVPVGTGQAVPAAGSPDPKQLSKAAKERQKAAKARAKSRLKEAKARAKGNGTQ